MAKEKNHGGIVHIDLEPGGFYYCTQIGGWADIYTGIIVPGMRNVTIDPISREVSKVELPLNPVQLPHVKTTPSDKKDPTLFVETLFGAWDWPGTADGLTAALNTGIIVEATDEQMLEIWPEALANKNKRIVYDRRQRLDTNTAMADVIGSAFDKARAEIAASKKDAKAARLK